MDQKFEDYVAAMFGHLSDIPWDAIPTSSDAFATASSIPGGDVETSGSGSVPQDPSSTQDTSSASAPLRVRCPLVAMQWYYTPASAAAACTIYSPAHYTSMQAHYSCIRVVQTSTPAAMALQALIAPQGRMALACQTSAFVLCRFPLAAISLVQH